ncbi:hypothetical protein PISMIDRAFT_680591 [Pisolithus microcarpus 441]|uniref:Uncharacterized protein n=1 Tax=Pisolithus microcarpus 441 TaxID=765257 RepID=A0A0C9ZQU4_9AGAM|nr:hypothetical protein BKA83DRAFT_680591 [Pisolithus microcarpus]KIK22083.1 hypothetical protein PISMIDRAFT_680591 [Pisolithus microcarpus 441]
MLPASLAFMTLIDSSSQSHHSSFLFHILFILLVYHLARVSIHVDFYVILDRAH